MATNQNNMHINSFTKGMNTDTSLDMVGNEQYTFGQNIRITNNALIDALIDSNDKQGIVTPVNAGQDYQTENMYSNREEILALTSIGNTGVVVVKDDTWSVYRVVDDGNKLTFAKIFKSKTPVKEGVKSFSILMNKEEEDLIKVYIADCEHEIICMDVNEDYTNKNIDQLISNHIYPDRQIRINKKIAGTLKTQQLQYTYRFYKRKGIASKLAPLTNKIQVINENKSNENGNAKDTTTSIGFQLQIPYDNKYDVFDYVQIYRISYIKENTNAEVNLIHDAKIAIENNNITVNDTGLESLQELSIEEFAGINGLDLIPNSIEQNQNYMFVANTVDETVLRNDKYKSSDFIAYSFNSNNKCIVYNDATYENSKTYTTIPNDDAYYLNKYSDINIGDQVQDPCMYKYNSKQLGGSGKKISWNFISTHIPIHDKYVPGDYKYQDVPSVTEQHSKTIYTLTNNGSITESASQYTIDDYMNQHNIYVNDSYVYDDMITSSMLRSLKRNEVYRYGIIIYDEFGRRSNVYWIADVRTPSEQEYSATILENGTLYARPIGVHFDVDIDDKYSYQIVRCQKTNQYTKNLLQCVLARPIRQPLWDAANNTVESEKDKDGQEIYNENTHINNVSGTQSQMSPYYPQQFLTSNYYRYDSGFDDDKYLGNASNFNNNRLFQIFNPQINVQRNDEISILSNTDIKLQMLGYVYGNNLKQDALRITPTSYYALYSERDVLKNIDKEGLDYIQYRYQCNATVPWAKVGGSYDSVDMFGQDWGLTANKWEKERESVAVYKKYKQQVTNVFYYYNKDKISSNTIQIKNIKDVPNPTWEEGWDNIQIEKSIVSNGSKTYKGFTTNVGAFEYVNWVCSNLYDLKVGEQEDAYHLSAGSDKHSVYNIRISEKGSDYDQSHGHLKYVLGCQGPGPVCFLMELDDNENEFINNSIKTKDNVILNGSLLCNIQHAATQFAGLTKSEKQYDLYYGFGNTSSNTSYNVFDGDVYIMPCEIVTMFKTYDFQATYSLQSSQFVYYVPMETTINTFFDYGLNYRNTQSPNLQLEPGEIVGIAVQDRSLTQYNSVYSENNISNDVFNTETIEKDQNNYPQRIHYSELKTNGEAIDSWGNYKATDYIDCDTRYGDVTNLLTSKDVLYFWQEQGFGRLSVNERSLVKDQNSNSIQLGQGGVLQRTDYIDTKHGMRKYDRSSISAENAIFWIDIINKAVVQSDGQRTIDYGKITNVQNIINRAISENIPVINYDIQNNELLCKFLKDGKQLIFNLKLNAATSLYTRVYDRILNIKNILYGLNDKATKYNYLQESTNNKYLSPTELQFVVNPNSSTTKVFDNQEVITLNRGEYRGENDFLKNKEYSFYTNLYRSSQLPEGNTDREGNIRYAIPRLNGEQYGNRIRGKWMQVDIVDNNPKYEQSISHIITTFRQSFS